jgi:predicted alpha/beta hydrolase family esterase
MTKRILFIHSAGPQGPHQGSTDFIQTLRKQTGPDYRIITPKMPNPSHPLYNNWKSELERHLEYFDDEVILIGHSLGGALLLKYFSEMPYQKPVAALFVIASPFWGIESDWYLPEFTLVPSFAARLLSIPKISFYHSKDDEIVPIAHLNHYKQLIPFASFTELDHGGHLFNSGLPGLSHEILAL